MLVLPTNIDRLLYKKFLLWRYFPHII